LSWRPELCRWFSLGSDVETVIKTQLEIANSNADVIKGNPQPPVPCVLFVDFSDSSLGTVISMTDRMTAQVPEPKTNQDSRVMLVQRMISPDQMT
jgi:hypothetical protein